MVVQYNTNFDLEIDADKFSPFPITMSRDRVTQENSEVRILKPDHQLLNTPNKISSKDLKDGCRNVVCIFHQHGHLSMKHCCR